MFVLVGVFLISLLYSYKVARPFGMIKDLAREMAAGKPNIDIKRFERDEVHPLAEAMNKMAEDSKRRSEHLRKNIEFLSSEARTLLAICGSEDKEEFERIYRSLAEKTAKLEKAFEEMKL
jgi:HAMP domain-containing protein